MKKLLSVTVFTLITTMLLTSCSSEKSLQEYYIDKQSNNDFIAIDLPSSLIDLKDNVSEESQETP